MVSRRIAAARKQALIDDLRASIHNGDLQPGDMIPGLRELSDTYQLSRPTVAKELQPLLDEGVLQALRSVGFVVTNPIARSDECFLFLTPAMGTGRQWGFKTAAHVATLHGFEQRATSYGMPSLALGVDELIARIEHGTLPPLAGVFCLSDVGDDGRECIARLDLPCVAYGARAHDLRLPGRPADTVSLDNVGGGRQAVQQLLRRGCRQIAFLGVHSPADESDWFVWSREREAGWREALLRYDPAIVPLSLHPDAAPNGTDRAAAYRRAVADVAAVTLAHRHMFEAVVGADDKVIFALIEALWDAAIPETDWPVMVGFEGMAAAADYVLTSVRPQWHDLGAVAADLLWQRTTSRLVGPATNRTVPMSVIARPSPLPRTPEPRGGTPAATAEVPQQQ